MLKRFIATTVSFAMLMLIFSGCAKTPSTTNTPNNQTAPTSAPTAKVLNLIEGAEPETIDPALNSTIDGGTYILHFFEGLTRVDAKENTVPGVAESWTISTDGTKYTFKLRNNAKWSDGQPVKAADFEYAWKRVLDPKTASSYSNILYYIKNAEAYNKGKATADSVGVKATGDYALEVTLSSPTAFFLNLMSFPTYMPVRKDIIEKYTNSWTQSPESYVSNGAYKLKEWKHKDTIVVVKNDNYWDKDNVKIAQINWKLVEDDNAALSAFEAGSIDALLCNRVPVTEVKPLIDAGKVKTYPILGVYHVQFNVTKKPFDNPKIRKALSMAIDRQQLVDNITKVGQKAAVGMVPFGTSGAEIGVDFRSESGAGSFISPTADVAGAKKLLAEAGYPDGKGLPTFEIIYGTSSNNQKVMEYLQEQWKKNLGVQVKLSNMESKAFYPRQNKHEFTIAKGTWIADYNDPMTFLDIFITGNENNYPLYNNPNYDKLLTTARTSVVPAERMSAMHQAEKLLMEDMPTIPLYYNVTYQMENPKITGMVTSKLGYNYLHYADIK